ncbi:MAG: HAMP domain-containing histidine kinase [Myxococcales bacterium]|nr:HAMP domain-containing histidine kinase [Myxococcales bacterium]
MQQTIETISLPDVHAPIAIFSEAGRLLSASPSGLDLLSRLGVETEGDPKLPRELLDLVVNTPLGRSAEWRPMGEAAAGCLGFTPYRLGSDNVLVLMREVTDRHRILSQRLHEQDSDSTSRLVGMIADDLRNALAGIVFNADVLSRDADTLSTDQRSSLEAMQGAAARLTWIVDGLLDLAHLGPPVQASASVEEIFKRVAKGVRPALRDADHRLEHDLSPAGVRVYANPLVVQQLLTNLVMNSAEASSAPLRISLSAELLPSSEDKTVAIRIIDDGPGIASSLAPHVFDPYFSTRHGKKGMGLTHAREAARDLGGNLTLESSESGAAFTLLLPAAEPLPDDDHDDGAHSR